MLWQYLDREVGTWLSQVETIEAPLLSDDPRMQPMERQTSNSISSRTGHSQNKDGLSLMVRSPLTTKRR
jgi:hypothetical protein